MNLSIEHREPNPESAVIRLTGRLQLGPGCADLEKLILSLFDRGVLHLTFELDGLTHMDSTGMGRFIDAYSKLKNRGGTVRVQGATGGVREMFRITRLDAIFGLD
jgi:anti-anti-sigma factor